MQPSNGPAPWHVYILRCADGSYYTGTARDVARRVQTHNAGRGARYTRSRLPVEAVYSEDAPDRSAALKRELAVKRLTHAQKTALIGSAPVERLTPPGRMNGSIASCRQQAR